MSRKGPVAELTPANKHPTHSVAVAKDTQVDRSVTTNSQQPAQQLLVNEKSLPFTQSQLSLALSIQKSKPPGISTRDYCLQLRNQIKIGEPPVEGEHRYIDTAEFWKEQYSRLHSEKKELEARVTRLESLTNKNDEHTLTQPWFLIDGNLENIWSRKRKATIAEPVDPDGSVVQPSDPFIPERRSRDSLPLLKHALKLHRLLQDNKATADILLSAIQSCLSYIRIAVGDISKYTYADVEEDTETAIHRASRTFNTIAAIFNLCLEGLALLCRDIPGRRCKGRAIYSFVRFFTYTLYQFHKFCVDEAALKASNTNHKLLQARDNSHSQINRKGLTLVPEFSHFLANILTCPEIQKSRLSDVEVLEGMLSALLEGIGKLVSQAVFDPDLGIARVSEGVPISAGNLALDIEGLHLVSVLRRVVEGRSENENYSLIGILAGPEVSGTNTGKEILLTRTKRRLQETLLKGIFGGDGKEFVNALKMPESGEGWDLETTQVATDHKWSFVESVWSVVGWDMALRG